MRSFQHIGLPTRSGRSRRLIALVAVVALACLAIGVRARAAFAQDTEPTTTTEPAPDTTTTTEPPPDTTTTTAPAGDTTTTTTPADTTTTAPPTDSTTTTVAPGTPALPAPLGPGEALAPRPEFASLTGHQRALVLELQTATDAFALGRFALVDLGRQVAVAKDALTQAQSAEHAAIQREILGLVLVALPADDGAAPAVSTHTVGQRAERGVVGGRSHGTAVDQRLAGVRRLVRPLDAARRYARLVRVQAQADVAAANARLTTQSQAVADAKPARSDAESAIEQELGSDAVRAQPDGITATLAAVQAGQPDPIVIAGFGQPIPGAALASPFGLRDDPLGGGAGFHPGLDLAASAGTPIHAAAAGVVITAGDCGGYGNCVVIDHGSSLATLYGHQSAVFVQVGERVDAGQVIGAVGSTGMSTGPHLHFEVRLHGLPIDPLLALFAT